MRSRRAPRIAMEVTPASSNLGNARAAPLQSHIWSEWMPPKSSIERSMRLRKRKPANRKKKTRRRRAPKRKRRKKRQQQQHNNINVLSTKDRRELTLIVGRSKRL